MFLLSERSILNFGFGFISVILYIILCVQNHIYGEAIYYLIDFALIFPAFISWRRSIESNGGTSLKVKSKVLKPWLLCLLPFGIAAFTIVYGSLLRFIGGEHSFLDALSSGVTFVATVLSWKQFREQWFGWIFVYIVSIILWAVVGNLLMVVMSIGCLIFSIKGVFEWYKNI